MGRRDGPYFLDMDMNIDLTQIAKPKFELRKLLYRRHMPYGEISSVSAFTPMRSEIVIRRTWKTPGAFSNQAAREEACIDVRYSGSVDGGDWVSECDLFATPAEAFNSK